MHPTSPKYVKRQFSMHPCEDPRPIAVTQKIYFTKLRFLPALLCGSWSLRVDMLERMKDHCKNKQMIMIIIIIAFQKKNNIFLLYSHTAKKYNIYIHIFTPPSVFTPTKSFQHATRKAGSITDQVKPSALANKALVGLPSFRHTSHLLSPTMFIILDSIHLIIQDTILETLPFLLRVTRLSNANNRRPDVSSSLTSVVALPAGSCSLSVRIETWHCLGTEHRLKFQEFTDGLSGRWSALKGSTPTSPKSNTTTPAARMHLRQLLHHSQEHRSLWSFWMSRHLEWREFHMVCRSKMFRVTEVETIWVVKQRQIKTSCHPKH